MAGRKLILYIACSVDGYIAAPGDDLGFLDRVVTEGEDYGYESFIHQVDTVILGRRTYDWVLERTGKPPHPELQAYVITRTGRPDKGNTTFYSGKIPALVRELKSREGKHIFCDGGGQVVHELLKRKLLDELIISVVPVLLGEGIPLFRDGRPSQALELQGTKTYATGLVQLHYKTSRDE